MTVLALLNRLRSAGIRVTCKAMQLVIDAPAGTLTEHLRSEIAACKADLIDHLLVGLATQRKEAASICARIAKLSNPTWQPSTTSRAQALAMLEKQFEKFGREICDLATGYSDHEDPFADAALPIFGNAIEDLKAKEKDVGLRRAA